MTEVAIPRCGLCGHRAHGDGPCGCMDLGALAAGRDSCGCWPEIMPYPGQREMFVARRMLALARPSRPNDRILSATRRDRSVAFEIKVDPTREDQWRAQEAMLLSMIVDPPEPGPVRSWFKQIDWRLVVLYLGLSAAVVLPAVIIAAALGLL